MYNPRKYFHYVSISTFCQNIIFKHNVVTYWSKLFVWLLFLNIMFPISLHLFSNIMSKYYFWTYYFQFHYIFSPTLCQNIILEHNIFNFITSPSKHFVKILFLNIMLWHIDQTFCTIIIFEHIVFKYSSQKTNININGFCY